MPASELARLQKAVKDKCLDCSGGNMHEVEDCPIKNCPLYIYRLGLGEAKVERRKLKDEYR